jgi:hypothetical protein
VDGPRLLVSHYLTQSGLRGDKWCFLSYKVRPRQTNRIGDFPEMRHLQKGVSELYRVFQVGRFPGLDSRPDVAQVVVGAPGPPQRLVNVCFEVLQLLLPEDLFLNVVPLDPERDIQSAERTDECPSTSSIISAERRRNYELLTMVYKEYSLLVLVMSGGVPNLALLHNPSPSSAGV